MLASVASNQLTASRSPVCVDAVTHRPSLSLSQNKCYPREALLRGRVRVSLRGEDGKPLNPNVPTRTALLRQIAELLPKHPNRLNKPRVQGGLQAEAAAAASAAAAAEDGGSASKSAAGKKKAAAGKKKR